VELVALLDEVRGYPGDQPVPEAEIPVRGGIFVPLRLRHRDRRLSFFSTIATFGAPLDVTLSELAIESCYPADADTGEYLRRRGEVSGRIDHGSIQTHPT